MKDKESMDTICIKCGYRYDQHRVRDAACPIKHGVGFYMEHQHFCAHPKEIKEVGIRKPTSNCLDCTVWIINANHTHPASESCKQCHYYKGIAAEGVYCAKENPKEEEVEEKQKYKVIKEFTKYDYIVAHQKKYGWTSFKDSCAEFQKDMGRWTDSDEEIHDRIFQEPLYSPNFYKHGVMFGFIEKVEPELDYNKPIVAEKGSSHYMLGSNGKGKEDIWYWFNLCTGRYDTFWNLESAMRDKKHAGFNIYNATIEIKVSK